MDLSIKSIGPRNLGFVLSDERSLSYDTVTVVAGSGKLQPGTLLGQITASKKWGPSPATGATGAETAKAVLAYAVDATSADVDVVVLARLGEVKKPYLVVDATVNDATKLAAKYAQLVAANIIPR
ncbi:hypothetical protein FHS55_002132 [Angulomicrobium tetraedrale]|uniref:Head decoration protein n=1 Tax=Ancylobacter tetraedralis TaxID=217068 RepID=A0A839Z9X3_9HYPH|nr:head decoration protein [Ancylobacter tetraedralis]MBB3771533.1 hypothetical protein [Ancylobacter tetraedralis]